MELNHGVACLRHIHTTCKCNLLVVEYHFNTQASSVLKILCKYIAQSRYIIFIQKYIYPIFCKYPRFFLSDTQGYNTKHIKRQNWSQPGWKSDIQWWKLGFCLSYLWTPCLYLDLKQILGFGRSEVQTFQVCSKPISYKSSHFTIVVISSIFLLLKCRNHSRGFQDVCLCK